MKNLLICAVVVFIIFACGQTPKQTATTVGSDMDEHGCNHSAGFFWSALKNECIRVFEAGVDLEPVGDVDKTTNAFAIFKSLSEDAQAEIFMTGLKSPVLLTKNQDGKWTNETYILKTENGVFTLEDSNGKALYKGALGE